MHGAKISKILMIRELAAILLILSVDLNQHMVSLANSKIALARGLRTLKSVRISLGESPRV